MKKLSKISVILLILSISFSSCNKYNDKPYAVNGVLNLTDYHIQKVVSLDGEWEFYWNELISPKDFRKRDIEGDTYTKIPGTWDNLTEQYPLVSKLGVATYRLRIYKQFNNSRFGIKLNKINVAYKIWINGDLLYEAGKVAEKEKNIIPAKEVKTHYFVSESDKIEIILQVSNFNHNKGGIESSILLGVAEKMKSKEKWGLALNFFLFGLLLIVAINHIILYWLRRDVTSSLYFALLIFSIAFNFILIGNHNILSLLFPNMSWAMQIKLDFIGDYVSLFLFLKYISSLFKEECSKKVINFILIYSILLSIFVLVTSPLIFTYSISQFHIVSGILIIYILLVLAKAIVSGKEGSKQAMLGTIILVIALTNDTLNNNLIINTLNLLPYGLAIFIIIQSYLISFRLSKAYQYSVQLTDELDYFNDNLEKIVKDRTSKISQQKEELEVQSESLIVANDEIVKINQILEGQSVEIQKKNKALTDSVNYAKRLQDAVLPEQRILRENFPDHFILFKPKDIVSGDFFWYGEVDSSWDFDEASKTKIIIAADCTGHGVPGAFMTLLGHNFLHLIVNIQEVVDPEQILYKLDQLVIETLKQRESGTMKDGMDIAVMSVDEEKEIVNFSGAGNPIFYIRGGELFEVKGSHFGIGGVLRKEKVFTPTKIPYQKGDIFYMLSDGFADQIGGPDGRKYYKKRFKELLVKIHHKPIMEQEGILDKVFEEWRGEKKQIDDVLVMGIKF
ncbi:MAG: hypothetical protein DRJ10_15425 [Bacteroidetes bacterium]|nr:MAG: hypothetical protein DRJ10_15425 [Bacteroidota bacterium]